MEFIEIASGAIIDKLKSILDQDVAVTDLGGNVVADSEMKYYGKNIPAASEAIAQNNTLEVSKEQLEHEGKAWVTPLLYDKAIVGSLIIKDTKNMSPDQIPIARSLAELLIHQVMVLRVLPSTSHVLDKFFYDLLEGAETNQERMIEQSKFLDAHYYQTRLESNRIVALVSIPGFWQKSLSGSIVPSADAGSKISKFKETLQEIFKSQSSPEADALVTYFSGDNFTALISEPQEAQATYDKISKALSGLVPQIKTKLAEPEIKIALGPFYPGLKGLLKSYKEATAVLRLGLALYPQQDIYMPADILVPRLLSEIPVEEQKTFVNYYLNGVLDEPALLATLNAYFAANLNLKETARKLNIHKNTLYYRFEKIRKQIGLDPRSFHNAVKLSLALLIHQISQNHKKTGEKP